MAGIMANIDKQASREKRARVQMAVAGGATRRAVAAIEGLGMTTVDKICLGIVPKCRFDHGGYRPTSERDRQQARQDGWRAAMEGRPESACLHGVESVALRAAWMAAYHDHMRLRGS